MIPIARPQIGEAEKKAVLEVLDSGMLVQGPRVKRLEERFAEVCGTRYAIATSSGTTALHIALLAHDIGPGDEVITTPFTFIATVNPILFVGAKPVFVDIEEETFNINPALIEAAVTPRTQRDVQGPADGKFRHRLFQSLRDEKCNVRRGRNDHHRRRKTGRALPAATQSRYAATLPLRISGLQFPYE
jgi:hypothetical protein